MASKNNARIPFRPVDLIVCLFLLAATFVAFSEVRNHAFLEYDDPMYVTKNPHVSSGLTLKGIMWAFATTNASNWHPLTWLSHMLDCDLYGMAPGGHHLTSLLFHIVNTLLLFGVLKRMTGELWKSALVAALFSLHPVHVESVAWVAERKDVLSAFFLFITIWAYVRYVEFPGLTTYVWVPVFLALGLMAKPMLVTVPFLLLLMDYWPLKRFRFDTGQQSARRSSGSVQREQSLSRLIREKVPLFVLAAGSCGATLFAQQSGGALSSLERLPLSVRIANALVSYAMYIGKMIWPANLSVFYPHPELRPVWQAAAASLVLLCLSLLVVWMGRRHRYLVVGWLWYVGTLVPVIGLVQVGAQAMADRYTYIPLIGLFIIVAWGFGDLTAKWRHGRLVLAACAGPLLLALMIQTQSQVRCWRNDITLFGHAVKVTSHNWLAHNNLGLALAKEGRFREAVSHYFETLRIHPGYAEAHNNLGSALAKLGKAQEAVHHYAMALQTDPNLADAHNNLGNALATQGRLEEALGHYTKALEADADFAQAHYNAGNALGKLGKLEEAVNHFRKAVQIDPNLAEAHNNLGIALARLGRPEEAIHHFSRALQIEPNLAAAHYNAGNALADQGRLKEAVGHYRKALQIKPDYEKAQQSLNRAVKELDMQKSPLKPLEGR